MELKQIHEDILIDVDADKMWSVLSQYGDVSQFHAGVAESYKEPGSDNTASLGCERVCNIIDLGLHITLKERILEFVEGRSYKYEVYEWKNFPIRKMFFGFTIYPQSDHQTALAINIEYKAKPAILTPILAGKMRRLARNVLLGYKHFTETGERRVPIKSLIKRYKSMPNIEVTYG